MNNNIENDINESFVIGAQVTVEQIETNMCTTEQLAVYYQCINNCDKCSGVASQEQRVAWCVNSSDGTGPRDCTSQFRHNEDAAGTCSDPTKTTRSQCLEMGICSDEQYTTKLECEGEDKEWTPSSDPSENTWTQDPNFETQSCPTGCVALSAKYMHEVAMNVVQDCKLGYKEIEGETVPVEILAKQYMCTPSGAECSNPTYTSEGETVCEGHGDDWIPAVDDSVPCTSDESTFMCPRGSGLPRSPELKGKDTDYLNHLQAGEADAAQALKDPDDGSPGAVLPMGASWSHAGSSIEKQHMRAAVQSIIDIRLSNQRWGANNLHP